MQHAKTLFDEGRLADAIGALNEAVRARPADAAPRTFLFELLCFQGDLDRAGRQLAALAGQSAEPGFELAVDGHRQLLEAEASRRAAFLGSASPSFIVPPPAYVERCAALLGEPDELLAAVEAAEDAMPPVSGTRGGGSFASIRDGDDRIAAVLEVFHGAAYAWVPFEQIAQLEIARPTRLRDMMWAPARLEIVGGPAGEVFIPALYVDSHRHESDDVRLGRTTAWQAVRDRLVIGAGLRTLLVDGEDVPLFDLGAVRFDASTRGAPAFA